MNLLKTFPLLYKVTRFFATIIPIEHKSLIVDTLNVGMFGKLKCDYVDPPNTNDNDVAKSIIENNTDNPIDNVSINVNNNNINDINDIIDNIDNHDDNKDNDSITTVTTTNAATTNKKRLLEITSKSNITTRAKKIKTNKSKSMEEIICKKK